MRETCNCSSTARCCCCDKTEKVEQKAPFFAKPTAKFDCVSELSELSWWALQRIFLSHRFSSVGLASSRLHSPHPPPPIFVNTLSSSSSPLLSSHPYTMASLSRNFLRSASKASHLPAYSRNAIPSSSRFVQLTAEASRPQQDLPESRSEKFKVDLNDDSFKGYKFDVPKLEWETSKDELIHLYGEMVKMRRMEMAADQLYKQKLIRGFCTWLSVRRLWLLVWRPV